MVTWTREARSSTAIITRSAHSISKLGSHRMAARADGFIGRCFRRLNQRFSRMLPMAAQAELPAGRHRHALCDRERALREWAGRQSRSDRMVSISFTTSRMPFAVCSFADELAHASGKDPVGIFATVVGRFAASSTLPLMGVDYPTTAPLLTSIRVDTGRLCGVLDLVVAHTRMGWPATAGTRARGRGSPQFPHLCGGDRACAVAQDGQVTIPRVDVAARLRTRGQS